MPPDPKPSPDTARDVATREAPAVEAQALENWFAQNARDLPWRRPPARSNPKKANTNRRDPYPTLVSELMLQQTQVSRVLEKYQPFLDRFPTLRSLAEAPEDAVLAEWSGLGYYRRARMLHRAAQAIVNDHNARTPTTAIELEKLPGIGDYTAGAIASLCFREPAPAVDGNVTRVILRLEGADLDQTSSEAKRLVTNRARTLVEAAHDPGDLNEALIELGATVCTPRNPACDRCPLNHTCRAHAEGTTDRIPRPKKQAAKTALYCAAILVKDARGRTLIEQRPGTGLWARMFQAPTLERPDAPWTPADIAAALNIEPPSPADTFRHQTTHRDVEFRVFQATKATSLRPGNGRRFATRREIESLALSNPQRRILLGDQPR